MSLKGTDPTPAASPPDDIFSHILGMQNSLSRSHKLVAAAILTQPKLFIESPIEDLAPWIGVSAPTITRFCRTVGCEGLRELKLRLMGGLRVGLRYIEPPTRPESTAEAVERVVHRAHRAVAAAAESADVKALEHAADIISRCRILYVFGGGGVSSWLVEEVQNRLFRLGIHVIPCVDHQMQMMLAATADRVDVVLCCSLTGRNAELIKAAKIAAEYGAATIALTTRGAPLADAVELPLILALRDEGDILSPTGMRYGFLIAIDILAYIMALRNSRPAQHMLRRIKQQFMTHRDEDDTQPLSD
ncbi:MAG: MurR/RpiR family transcriptional regulator [Proteobacteria bacterium]|nr:MurR/RpiR family transcriptional regulator [Pseudomonadota bacterium]